MARTPPRPSHLVIAGVNKAGTTSLFASLSEHPGIAAAAVKETRYFLPARYGRPLEPIGVFDGYFAGAPAGAVRLEATPSYVYGGRAVAEAIDTSLPDPRVVVVLREPVSRAVSFFRYQKARLRFPADLTLDEYLADADRLVDAADDDPANERFMAFRGGCYAAFLPPWFERFGSGHLGSGHLAPGDQGRLRVLFFEDLMRDPLPVLRSTVAWLGLDPADVPAGGLRAENRTTGYRSKGLQRVALAGNDRLERFLRRHMGLKRRLRAAYYWLNGRPRDDEADHVSDGARAALAERYREPNAALATLLAAEGVPLPDWLHVAAERA
jgi:hypothetical protein